MNTEEYAIVHEAIMSNYIRAKVNLEDWRNYKGTMSPTEVLAHTAYAEGQFNRAKAAREIFEKYCL